MTNPEREAFEAWCADDWGPDDAIRHANSTYGEWEWGAWQACATLKDKRIAELTAESERSAPLLTDEEIDAYEFACVKDDGELDVQLFARAIERRVREGK